VKLITAIDQFIETIGGVAAWLALLMVIVQFVVVVLRYTFAYGSIFLQESIVYLHATTFMVGAACVLLRGGHVRVDIFYSSQSPRQQALVDLGGCLLFLIPFCILVLLTSWPIMMNSWAVFEGSKETSGIQAVFILKSLPVIFAALLLLQGFSMALRAFLIFSGRLTQPVECCPRTKSDSSVGM